MAAPSLYAGMTFVLEPLAGAALAWLARREPAALRAERLGRAPLTPVATWWHAASLGEMTALEPVLKRARERGLAGDFAVTATSATGRAVAERLWPGHVSLAPVDLPRAVARTLAARRPRSLIVVETELWPNWLGRAARSRTRLALVNARLSDRSFPRYRRWAAVFRPVLAAFGAVAARTEVDAERWIALGVRPEAVRVTGNTKHDRLRETPPLPLPWPEAPVVTVGSLRHGDETVVLAAMAAVAARRPDVRFVVAPRHPARWPDLAEQLEALGFPAAVRSTPRASDADARVLVLDTHGELSAAYAAASVSLIGGTWAPVGGHNPLEAAVNGSPIVTGLHTATVAQETAVLEAHGALRRAQDAGALVEALDGWLADGEFRSRASAGARAAAASLAGASERALEWLVERGVLAEPETKS